MPGGQYTNLMFQSQQLGLAGQWKAVVKAYIDANKLVRFHMFLSSAGLFADWAHHLAVW